MPSTTSKTLLNSRISSSILTSQQRPTKRKISRVTNSDSKKCKGARPSVEKSVTTSVNSVKASVKRVKGIVKNELAISPPMDRKEYHCNNHTLSPLMLNTEHNKDKTNKNIIIESDNKSNNGYLPSDEASQTNSDDCALQAKREQRSELRALASSPNFAGEDMDKAEELVRACAKGALDGNEVDLELLLGLAYSDHYYLREQLSRCVPEIYARYPDKFARCLMKVMLREDSNVSTNTKPDNEWSFPSTISDAPMIFYALCYHLHNNASRLRALPDIKLPDRKVTMGEAIDQCWAPALRYMKQRQLTKKMNPTNDSRNLLAPDRLIQPGELDCARDVLVNFGQKKNRRTPWYARIWKLFTFSLSKSDYVVRSETEPVRYGGVVKWHDGAGWVGDYEKSRRIFRSKIDFVVDQHLKEWKAKEKGDLTTIFDICEMDDDTGVPLRYSQLVLRNDSAVIVDTTPPRDEKDSTKYRDVIRHLGAHLRRTRLKNMEIQYHYLPRTTKQGHTLESVTLPISKERFNPKDRELYLHVTPTATHRPKGARRPGTQDQGNVGGLMGLYLKEQLEKTGKGAEQTLSETIQGTLRTYSRMHYEAQSEIEMRLRLQLAYDVDADYFRLPPPWEY